MQSIQKSLGHTSATVLEHTDVPSGLSNLNSHAHKKEKNKYFRMSVVGLTFGSQVGRSTGETPTTPDG